MSSDGRPRGCDRPGTAAGQPGRGGDDGGVGPAADPAATALRDVADLLERTARELVVAARHAHHTAESRSRGRSWREIVRDEQQPFVVERLNRVLDELGIARSRLRHEQARALMREDLSITEIGRLFGISRQRVSLLVNRTYVR